jgi:hypothetical protein
MEISDKGGRAVVGVARWEFATAPLLMLRVGNLRDDSPTTFPNTITICVNCSQGYPDWLSTRKIIQFYENNSYCNPTGNPNQ